MIEPVKISEMGGTIRLTMTARTANDLGALQKGLKSLAERLGHPSCATGCDILHLSTEREFTLGSAAELNPQPIPPGASAVELNPQPLPPRAIAVSLPQDPIPLRTVTVSIPSKVAGNIDALTKATAVVLGKLGCGACCSGFDILFRRELDLMVVDEKLDVQGFGRFR
jgi:hypothetical protein